MPYPLNAFPNPHPMCPIDLLPDPLWGAVLYAIKRKSIPPAIALTDAIASAGAIVHCGFDCLSPDDETMPTTINTCAVAPSASGKGRSIKVFFEHHLQALKRRKPIPSDLGEDEMQIRAWRRPLVEAMMNTVTFRALLEELDGEGMNVTVQREEGASFLTTDLFKRNADALTQLWSGDPPLSLHAHRTELVATDARCSFGFRIQPDLMYSFLRGDKRSTYKLGFWPRAIAGCHDPILFPWNETYRPYSIPDTSPDAFQQRARLLAMEINNRNEFGFGGRITVGLESDAAAFMLELGFRIREWKDSYYADVREAAGRAWENTLRIAVVLQVFCKGVGKVSREMTERAWAIVEWSLSQHRLIFVEAIAPKAKAVSWATATSQKPSQHQLRLRADAEFVLEAMYTRAPHCLWGKVPLSEILLMTGFERRRFLKALSWLCATACIAVEGVDEFTTAVLLQHPAAIPCDQAPL